MRLGMGANLLPFTTLTPCCRTGAQIAHRWVDITVLGMATQIFIPQAQYHQMDRETEVGAACH